jgi:hypothetical protein
MSTDIFKEITLNSHLLTRICIPLIENPQIGPVLQTSFLRGNYFIALTDYAGILPLRWSLGMPWQGDLSNGSRVCI